MDPHALTAPFQLTKTMRREIYFAVDPKNPENSAANRTVLITGATGGIGGVSIRRQGVQIVAHDGTGGCTRLGTRWCKGHRARGTQ